tara:strand:- start:2173 stop:2817 length:645 start_codon:yes stop_codon:yes gene_type:complete
MFEKNNLKIYNGDCVDLMKKYSDNYFDLAIVDPPYSIINKTQRGKYRSAHKYKITADTWDYKPIKNYWIELFRISKDQIIWGGNYFTNYLYENDAWIFWYKNNPIDSYSDGELAWTSFKNKKLKCFNYMYYGAINSDKNRFHPTQKPVKLYEWILKNYGDKNFKILDTHLGSGSSAIAAFYYGCKEFIGMEINKYYYNKSIKYIKDNTSQLKLL